MRHPREARLVLALAAGTVRVGRRDNDTPLRPASAQINPNHLDSVVIHVASLVRRSFPRDLKLPQRDSAETRRNDLLNRGSHEDGTPQLVACDRHSGWHI